MNDEAVRLLLPPKADYLIVARLSAAAIAGRAGLDIEQVEDVRAAVAEACLWMLPHCPEGCELQLVFCVREGLSVEVSIDGALEAPESQEARYSRYLIEALMDEVSWPQQTSGELAIRMVKHV